MILTGDISSSGVKATAWQAFNSKSFHVKTLELATTAAPLSNGSLIDRANWFEARSGLLGANRFPRHFVTLGGIRK